MEQCLKTKDPPSTFFWFRFKNNISQMTEFFFLVRIVSPSLASSPQSSHLPSPWEAATTSGMGEHSDHSSTPAPASMFKACLLLTYETFLLATYAWALDTAWCSMSSKEMKKITFLSFLFFYVGGSTNFSTAKVKRHVPGFRLLVCYNILRKH